MPISKIAMIVFFIGFGVNYFVKIESIGLILAIAALVAGFALAFNK